MGCNCKAKKKAFIERIEQKKQNNEVIDKKEKAQYDHIRERAEKRKERIRIRVERQQRRENRKKLTTSDK